MIARRYFFTGRVQGVGFRYATKQLAKGFDVQGTVTNLSDGRVELVIAADDEEELDEFMDDLHDSPLGHHILEQEQFNIPVPEGLRGFTIAD
ncbi:MAG: acylphosphatase [Verrucomicrobiota bacterium]